MNTGKRNIDGLAMFWDTVDFLHEIIESRMRSKSTRGRRKIWQWFGKWWWLCCTQRGSRKQRRMETQRKDVKNLLCSRRLLMMKKSVTWKYKGKWSQNCSPLQFWLHFPSYFHVTDFLIISNLLLQSKFLTSFLWVSILLCFLLPLWVQHSHHHLPNHCQIFL